MIELRPRKEKRVHRDPMTGGVLMEVPIFPEGVCVYVNGFASAYCDFPGGPCNIFRDGVEPLRPQIEQMLQDHFKGKQCKEAQCKIPQDAEEVDSSDD